MTRLSMAPVEIFALEVIPGEAGDIRLEVRLGGDEATFHDRRERCETLIERETSVITQGEEDHELWRAVCEFRWAPLGFSLVKVPLTPKRVPLLEKKLAGSGALRRYSVGANLGWIAWPEALNNLDGLLAELGLSGLQITGDGGKPLLGVQVGKAFAHRVRQALDPDRKFSTSML